MLVISISREASIVLILARRGEGANLSGRKKGNDTFGFFYKQVENCRSPTSLKVAKYRARVLTGCFTASPTLTGCVSVWQRR